jgi:hypothetical protein
MYLPFWEIFPRYKSCSSFSYLSNCVEIILFAVVFIEKNATKKKNRTLLKIFYLISPQWEHFRTKFQLILEATVQGYNFRFCPFLVIGHVTIIPHPIEWALTGIIIHILFIFTFWSNQVRFLF